MKKGRGRPKGSLGKPKSESLSSMQKDLKASSSSQSSKDKFKTWTDEEQQSLLEAIKKYGKAWKSVSEHVKTKSKTQIASRVQAMQKKFKNSENPEMVAVLAILKGT